MQEELFTLIVGDVHGTCPNCKDANGKHLKTYWKEMMKCKNCHAEFKKDDLPFYIYAMLYTANNPENPRPEFLVLVSDIRLHKIEYALNNVLSGIFKEVGERKKEESRENGKTYVNWILHVKMLGAIQAHK